MGSDLHGDRVRHHRRLVLHHAGELLRRWRDRLRQERLWGISGVRRKRLRMLRLRRRHARSVATTIVPSDARADDVARADAFAHASADDGRANDPRADAAADVARALGAERNADLAGCLRRRRRLSGHVFAARHEQRRRSDAIREAVAPAVLKRDVRVCGFGDRQLSRGPRQISAGSRPLALHLGVHERGLGRTAAYSREGPG